MSSHGRFDQLRSLSQYPSGRLLIGLVIAACVLSVAGLGILWPGSNDGKSTAAGKTESAKVSSVKTGLCTDNSPQKCVTVAIKIDSGKSTGKTFDVPLGPPSVSPKLATGDSVRVVAQGEQDGKPIYAFAGYDRKLPLYLLAGLVAFLGALVGGRKGLLALAGTGFSVALVVLWLVPSILSGSSPFAVAIVGSFTVMLVTTALTYGVTAQSLAAAIGIGASLILAAVLAAIWTSFASLDGTDGELASFALQSGNKLPLEGIVLAGMVIGALGVLTDTVVSQVSTVAALHRANSSLSAATLFKEAFVVGRDHLSATIHTLVLAYSGAALPLLLVASANNVGFLDAINDSSLAEPIVATLTGSAALIAAVPLATFLAAVLIRRLPDEVLGEAHHHHH